MKDEELKLEEIEASHTLGGQRRCRCYSAVRYTVVSRSHRICCHKSKGLDRSFDTKWRRNTNVNCATVSASL